MPDKYFMRHPKTLIYPLTCDLARNGQNTDIVHIRHAMGFCKIDSDLWTFFRFILKLLHLACYA